MVLSYIAWARKTRDVNLKLLPWCEGDSWRAGQDTEPVKGAVVHLARFAHSLSDGDDVDGVNATSM